MKAMNSISRLSEGRSYEGRGRYMTVRLSEEELKYAKTRALERSMTVSEYVRVLILADRRPTKEVLDAEAVHEAHKAAREQYERDLADGKGAEA